MFKNLTIKLDMAGCPNKCKYCKYIYTKSHQMQIDDLHLIYELFEDQTENIRLYSWYKEPDYSNNYKDLFESELKLSNIKEYERTNISAYRLIRDRDYIEWLKKINVQKVELTVSGNTQTSNYLTGRVNTLKEIVDATNILIENNITPMWKIIINKKNIDDMPKILKLIEKENFVNKLKNNKKEFKYYLENPKPIGENLKNIYTRITKTDIKKIPIILLESTIKNLNDKNPLGIEEKELYKININNKNKLKLINESPTFIIDSNFNVYPEISSNEQYWKLGNIKKDNINTIIENYTNEKLDILNNLKDITISDLVNECGNINGSWLFKEEDYIVYLLNQYIKKIIGGKNV